MSNQVCVSSRYLYNKDRSEKRLCVSYRPAAIKNGKSVTCETFNKLYLYTNPSTKEEEGHNKRVSEEIESTLHNRKMDYSISPFLLPHKGTSETLLGAMDYIIDKDDVSDVTKACRRTVYNIIKGYLEERRLSNRQLKDLLRAEDSSYLMDMISHIDKLELTSQSKQVYKAHFRSMLSSLFVHSFLHCDLSGKIRSKAHKSPMKIPLSVEEMQRLIDTECDVPIVKHLALFSYYTGLRKQDILNLRFSNIYTKVEGGNKSWFIDLILGKTSHPYRAKLDRRAVEIITEINKYRDNYPSEDKVFGYVTFHSKHRASLHQWVTDSGITDRGVTMHLFRHTFAKHMYDKGVPVDMISRLLGHASLNNTMIYLNNIKPIDAHLSIGDEKSNNLLRTDYVHLNQTL